MNVMGQYDARQLYTAELCVLNAFLCAKAAHYCHTNVLVLMHGREIM